MDGLLVIWGYSFWGGGSFSVVSKFSVDVEIVYSNFKVFVVLKMDGLVVIWGLFWDGGDFLSVGVFGVGCVDIDECIVGIVGCYIDVNCTNDVGSFVCVCNDGYFGDGTNDCSIVDCFVNVIGVFDCVCDVGLDGVIKWDVVVQVYEGSCAEINLCLDGIYNCNVNVICTDLLVDFLCVCNVGYSGDGVSCINDDECIFGIYNCYVNVFCLDNDGGFDCICDMGYVGDGIIC